jgi:hypothetical protein
VELQRPSVRRFGLAALALVLVIGASGCSGGVVGQAPAATVNGVDISQATLNQMVEDYAALVEAEGDFALSALAEQAAGGQAQPGAEDQLKGQIAEVLAPFQGEPNTYPTEGAALQLTQLITREVYEQALADAGGTVTDEQRAAAEENIKSGFKTFDDASPLIRDTYIETDAARAALELTAPKEVRDAVSDAPQQYEEFLRQQYDENVDQFLQVCGRVIGTTDQGAAQAAFDRVANGEDFAAVAEEVTVLDPTAGSESQCYGAADIAAAFGEPGANAAKGDLLGPLDQSTATAGPQWLILTVDSVQPATFEEARAALAEQFPDTFTEAATAALDEYLAERLVKAADVTVDPRFGTWNDETAVVDPPVVPVEPTTPENTTTIPVATTIPVVTGP